MGGNLCTWVLPECYTKDGVIKNNPSFLVTKKTEKVARGEQDENEDEDADAVAEEDIVTDKRVMKKFLRSNNTKNSYDVWAFLVKRDTLARQRTNDGNGGGRDGGGQRRCLPCYCVLGPHTCYFT